MKQPRRVVRKVTKVGTKLSLAERLKHAFTPKNIKSYWLSKRGAFMVAKIFGGGLVLLFLMFLYFAKDLPSPSKINSITGNQTTRFYANDELTNPGHGTLLYEVHGDENRTVIDFNQMPTNIKNATVAIEDKSFYQHGAFSVLGILRAAFSDLFHPSAGLQGGSTITQQYVKLALLSSDRSFTRKAKELILSIEIELRYSKADILKLYLNEIPYGNQAYGIQAAAKTYFKKDAKDLTLPESALLAAIPNLPTYYNPYGNNTGALIERQHLILDDMVAQKYITKQQADDAKKVDVLAEMPSVPATFANVTAPYFVKYVEAQLDDQYSPQVVDNGGLKVITTLDPAIEKDAEDAVSKNMATVRRLGGSNAALVAQDPKTGYVKAWVGGSDFSTSQVDVANAQRQPGSSFKPYVYATLFSQKTGTTYGPGTTLYDVPTDFGGGYQPKNYCQCNYGAISVRNAIGNSINIPAVKALYLAGVAQSIQTAHNMGITTLNNDPGSYGLSLVLGTGEVKLADMINGYSGFATGGNHVNQITVLKVTDSKGNVLEDNTKAQTPKRVLDPQVAYELNSIMSDASARTLTFGVNYAPLIIPGKTTAVKTGTTENYRDAWTIGYTQSLVSGVWAGNNDGHSMSGISGAVAAPIWHDFMVAATKNEPNQPFVAPAGIKTVTLDAITGRVVTDQTKQTRSDIFASWYQPIPATAAASAQVDKVSGKLATPCTPPLAVETVYSSAISAEIPSSDPAYVRWNTPVQALAQKLGYQAGAALPTDNDDKHSCSDTKPTVSLTVTDNHNGTAHVSATATDGSPFTLNQITITMDGQTISTEALSGSGSVAPFDQTASAGSHQFVATVTDSGYYQNTDTVTVPVTGTAGFNNVTPGSGATGQADLTTFSWTADSGASSYTLHYGTGSSGPYTTATYPGTSTSSSPILLSSGTTYYWYVTSTTSSTLQTSFKTQ
jgi:membrane peptidoglycan carboxypeptidase